MRQKYPCNKLEVKRGGAYFRENTIHVYTELRNTGTVDTKIAPMYLSLSLT